MNHDDVNADKFVEFEASLSSDLDDDFTTLYSSLENLVFSAEKKTSRMLMVTSEYVPSSVESSFQLGEEYSISFGDDSENPNAEKKTFRPRNFACSTEKKSTRTVALTSEFVPLSVNSSSMPGEEENLIDFSDEPTNSNAGKTALNCPEKALYEFVQFYTDPQISSTNLSKEIAEARSEDTKLDSPMHFLRDLTYRISSVVTPTSRYGSPLSEQVLSSSREYESCLNHTGQECLIRAMESLRIKSARKIKRNSEDLEDFYGNSEIASIVTPHEILESSNHRDKNCEDEQNAVPTEISLRPKSDMENLSSSTIISENQTTGRTCMIGKEDNSEIAKTAPSYEILENCEDEQSANQTEISPRSKWDIENLLFLANIAENQTTGRTCMIVEEDNSEIATTIQPYESVGASDFRDKNAEGKQSALQTEADTESAWSSASIAETQTTARAFTRGKDDKSETVETVPSGILESSSTIEDIEESSRVHPEDDCAPPKSVRPDAASASQKQRKNPRVLTSQVRRQSLKYRRSSGQFVSMAEAMLKFQRGTPKRFRSTVKKNQGKPARPKIKSLQTVTRPVSPTLRCRSRARPSKLPNQEEREMLEVAESRRNLIKATKSPGPQKSILPSEKSAASLSKDSSVSSAGELRTLPRRATPRRKILVKSVYSTEEGPEFEDVEIFNFGVPFERTKSPLTKPKPFSFEKCEKKIVEKREAAVSATMEDEKRKTIRPRSSAATSTVTSGSLEGAGRRPIDLTFRERNELFMAKKKLIADRARDEKQTRVFHARLAPPVKQVLIRGISAENLRPAKVGSTLKPARGTSTEKLGPAKLAPSVKQGSGRGSSTENLGSVKAEPIMQSEPRSTTSVEKFDPAKVVPMTKQVPGPTASTENLGLVKNKQKTRGLSPAQRSRGLSPAERSRGLSPATRSRRLSPAERLRGLSAERSKGLSPSIADRENRDPNISPIRNQCPKLKTPLSLYTEDRSKKRQEFDATRRRKNEEAEEQRREYEAYRLAQQKQEERELRKTMESRARPMPVFKQPKIAKSLKPLTDPQSPAWSAKKTKK